MMLMSKWYWYVSLSACIVCGHGYETDIREESELLFFVYNAFFRALLLLLVERCRPRCRCMSFQRNPSFFEWSFPNVLLPTSFLSWSSNTNAVYSSMS
jgi:hypothetical protein